MKTKQITLDHGSGGEASRELVESVFRSRLHNDILDRMDDSAVINLFEHNLAMTTDSYVVDPIFFPGGDIGSLSIHGTVNDLSMQGAKPLYLTLGLILEEGFPLKDLEKIIDSAADASKEAGIKIVAGDTKVVPKGNADKIFINTAGIGIIPDGIDVSSGNARPGDRVIINGDIGDHGIAILTARESLSLNSPLKSDSAALNTLVSAILNTSNHVHVLRDPTRGGVATALNEIATQSGVGIRIFEADLPVSKPALAASEILGLDPLYLANEGKCLIIAPPEDAPFILSNMKQHRHGKKARIIGEVTSGNPGRVLLKTKVGGNRILAMLTGEQLPRICQPMSKRFITILGILTLLAYAWPAWTRFSTAPMTSTSFSPLTRSEPSTNHTPFMDQDFISPGTGSGMVHVGSICEMPDGALGAVWYGGTREGAKDVAIFFSKKHPFSNKYPSSKKHPFSKKHQGINIPWSTPRIIVDRASATRELNRYIRKVGNPILFRGPGKHLWMIYVTITVGGWSGSSLNVKASRDSGLTWTDSRRLTLSPFFNISELVKGRPLPLKMTGINEDRYHFAVPIYHEFLGYFPEILWIAFLQKNQELIYEKSRMAGGSSFIQPSIAPLNTHSATAFYRCRSKSGHIAMARTDDGGQNWSSPRFLDLPNPDSAVDALPLSKGRILLAFNDSRNNRETLKLAVSDDRGLNWIRIYTLENLPGQEFSYPYMIRGKNGMIHLVYTWKRKRIKHVVFNEAWVDQKLERATQK